MVASEVKLQVDWINLLYKTALLEYAAAHYEFEKRNQGEVTKMFEALFDWYEQDKLSSSIAATVFGGAAALILGAAGPVGWAAVGTTMLVTGLVEYLNERK